MRMRAVFRLTVVVLLAMLWAACSAARTGNSSAAPAAAAPEMAQGGESAGGGIARKVVANADVSLVVQDTQTAVDEIEAMADELGGYLSDTSLYKDSVGLLQGRVVLRVPAESLNQALDRLTALALDVPSSNVTREDVTDQYSDVDAQLRNLEATEQELLALLAEVRERPDATAEDILAVHRSLTEIRGQIEQAQGQKNMLDNLIALSTIRVDLTPDAANRPVVEEGWRPGIVARDAGRSLVIALQGLGNLLIWFVIVGLPLIAVLAVVLGVAFLLLRGFLRWAGRRSPRRERAEPSA